MEIYYYKFENVNSNTIHAFMPIGNGIWKSLCGLKIKITDRYWIPSHKKCTCQNCLIEFKGINRDLIDNL